ncbi:MAG: hypothetical protein KTR30_02925 [Saprospiraceae bacterium]|nr:hypothetical protein [Saprospiraceae bacterium]
MVAISQVKFEGEAYFKISNSDAMRPFFMSLVSHSNHWMFISSNGGLSAGRKDSEDALFPYYTDDKITESAEITGSKSIFCVHKEGKAKIWEPFSERFEGKYMVRRNLYKSIHGNKLLFEEVNLDLGLSFRYQWCTSELYGFVRKSILTNMSGEGVVVEVLDGLQNIMPYGVPSDLQMRSSNLVDAYKKSELEKDTGLGIYSLSAIIVDKAEPSEALKANIVWSLGLDNPKYLLSSRQLKNFRKGKPIQEEIDVRAEKGAYLLNTEVHLAPYAVKSWMIIADVNKNHSALARISKTIGSEKDLEKLIQADIALCTQSLIALNAASDGLQLTADPFKDARHFSNVLFNIMRGGIFDNNYQIEKPDFTSYLEKANRSSYEQAKSQLDELPDLFSFATLQRLASQSQDEDFKRLSLEYMPLKFSRRHGDPSRPWNKFSINTRNELDGSKILDYEGNWRDIFQNWEALALAYPMFIESMFQKFLNATTFDGYNPYRVTKGGFDWEIIEPDDPWSYIGYWGDHQIIYLLKFLEFSEKVFPGKLATYFYKDMFVYANVPYRIKPFAEILKNPKDTIDFDHALDLRIRDRRDAIGADGALLCTAAGEIYRVNFIEKILATLLAKLSNFIPEGGIWMNTQRPEWNDANNALVGNGVSMVTLYYLHRFLQFFKGLLKEAKQEEFLVAEELMECFGKIQATFEQHKSILSDRIKDTDRMEVLRGVGEAGSAYREKVYDKGFSGVKTPVNLSELQYFIDISLDYLTHAIDANKRSDNLFHAYNLMTVESDTEVSVSYLSEMLEGQVAVLSAGHLSGEESLAVLDAMRGSRLYRPDQHSYLLYPNKDLPRFTKKNTIPAAAIADCALLTKLVQDGQAQILEQDIKGEYHFNGNFRNANDLKTALDGLADGPYADLLQQDMHQVLDIFEDMFDHKSFTGRSGTFFGYEGLGSIYWHMVSKLLLAVQESYFRAIDEGADQATVDALAVHFHEINKGIGVHKSPAVYGAFPTDPYSHTPAGKGAQQPGMTGQVKEDILSRFGELGVFVREGKLSFDPSLLQKAEFLGKPQTFSYLDVQGTPQALELPAGALGFTYCQVPIVYQLGEVEHLAITYADGRVLESEELALDQTLSQQLFERTAQIEKIVVQLKKERLR